MTPPVEDFEEVWSTHVEEDRVWSPAGARRVQRFTPDGPAVLPPPPPPFVPDEVVASPRRQPNRLIATMVALALVAGVAGAGVAAARRTSPSRPSLAAQPIPTAPTVPTPATTPATTPPASSATAATEGRRGIVEITTTLAFGSGNGAGSGMLLKSTGDVLTNNHVIDGTSAISVQINGTGRAYKATVVGTDATHDIALLRLESASGLTTIQTEDSSTLKVGDPVTAIGNALGQPGPPTVATGNVTALDQSITAGDLAGGSGEPLDGLIQTDVPLQPGDSGGPLLNSDAKVVGINTAASVSRRARATGNEGFSIPIERALAIAADIAAGRASSTIQIGPPAFLGVGLLNTPATAGAGIATVEPGTPAASAGLTAGDTIVSLDGTPVTTAAALRSMLDAHKPGDRVAIAWLDSDGQRHTASVTLAAGPPR
jgi:S1-C subfamily serine protease